MRILKKITKIRNSIAKKKPSIGSWIQIPHPSVAEIMGDAGYDWVAVDMEHGSISVQQLPDLFRALELGGTLPMVRIADSNPKDCKQALDAGAAGIIVPMVESAKQLVRVKRACCWPPSGDRGVGFSRANLFGKNFDTYTKEAQAPLLVAMIESVDAVDNLSDILNVNGLDAIMIGPYDLSASMGIAAKFESVEFINIMHKIKSLCGAMNIACGIHVVTPDKLNLKNKLDEGYLWIAYSIDSVFLCENTLAPEIN